MRNSEGQPQGGQRFGLRAGERRTVTRSRGRTPIDTYPPTVIPVVADRVIAPTRERELAPPPTKEETDKANRGAYAGETRVVQKVGGNKLLKIGLVGTGVVGGGVGAYETYQNIPAVHQTVDSAFLNHLKGKSLSSEVSTEVFNPQATEGVIKPSMIEQIPQEEITKLNPLAKIDDHNTVQVLFPIDVSTSKNPNVNIEYKKSLNISQTTGSQSHLEQQGFYNAFSSKNIPSGTIIYAPIDGKLILYTDSGNTPPINDRDYSTATIDFQVNGKDYRMIITGGKKNRGDIFNTLTNAPVTGGSQMSQEEVAKINNQAISIKRGDPILQVAEDKIDFNFWIRGDFDQSKAYKGLLNGQEVIFVPETPTNLDFFSAPNGGLIRLQK